MKKEKTFKTELTKLLSSPVSEEERDALLKLSVNFKNPTKMTMLAVAIYKKASGGDLSSLKEILNALGDTAGANERVILLDDIPKET